MKVKSLAKLICSSIGSHSSTATLDKLSSILSYIQTGHWMKARHLAPEMWVDDRIELIAQLANSIADKEVLYLEFGVFKGETIRLWSQLLKNPNSRLHGFDSFDGLPEAWADLPAGASLPKVKSPIFRIHECNFIRAGLRTHCHTTNYKFFPAKYWSFFSMPICTPLRDTCFGRSVRTSRLEQSYTSMSFGVGNMN